MSWNQPWIRNEIRRDGFISSYGQFRTERDRAERVDGATLRSMFLPTLTRLGQKSLNDKREFVRSQLQHYGVKFEESQFSGRGTKLMKQVLQDGGCDTVPPHILKLEEELYREWLNTQTLESLDTNPDWVLDKYFGSDRQNPDRRITTTILKVPFPLHSGYRVSLMTEAVKKVNGLIHELARGIRTQAFYMGWDKTAVEEAAKSHLSDERKEADAAEKKRKAEEKKRKMERTRLHTSYLLKDGKTQASPVGSYIVDCDEIEDQWPDQAQDMTIDIHPTDEPGIFKAEFDFGILDGVIIFGADEATVAQYCSRLDGDDDDSEDEDDSDLDDLKGRRKSKTGSKRNAPPSKRVKGPKKPKTGVVLKYELSLRCEETGEGEIYSDPEDGTIKFKDGKFASFTGEVGMPCVGGAVPFTARKVSDSPDSHGKEWVDYSDRRYESARMRRWH
ncbi:hypothetical protein N7540_004435 [Penicillium herquei]|nr:hypothetical protein N7540_004435 [Penicillium herquei]